MSSYLGLPAAVSGAHAVMARGVTVNPTTTAAVALTTAAQAFVVTDVILRSPNVALQATTSFKVGATGALSSVIATTLATSMATNAVFQVTPATTAVGLIASGATLYFSFVATDSTATTMLVDVLGYVP